VTAVEFPAHPPHVAFREVTRKHNDFAVLSVVATGHRAADGRWSDVRIALGGVADTPVLATAAGALLAATELTDADLAAAAEAALEVVDPPSDIRASAEYRRHLVPVHVRRVLIDLRDAGVGRSAEGATETNPAPGGVQP
jgi:carbon-monoxide dehydrogenase medium subunit